MEWPQEEGHLMPIASPEIYAEMLNRAKAGAFAYPAINVSSSQTLNAALKGFADAGSDGIVQVSTGGASYLSGAKVADMVVGATALGENGRYLLAATFGNVHGVYQSGHVKLRPPVLKQIQDTVGKKVGKPKPFDLVFHGGSGSLLEEIRETLDYGVVKMNIDTDTQYDFTRPIVDHMMKNYSGVLKVDGEVGEKKAYDPRTWGKAAEAGMAIRVVRACEDLRSAGTSLGAART